MENKKKSRISGVITVFIIGIAAILALIGYSFLHKSDSIILAGEGVALLSLIGLLVYSIVSHRRQVALDEQNSRSPYGEIDKKEISKIFDMIATEERKRGHMPVITSKHKDTEAAQDAPAAEENKSAAPEKPKETAKPDTSEEEEEDKLPIIFPDQDETEDPPSFVPLSEERAVARREKREQDAKKAKEDAEKRERGDAAGQDGNTEEQTENNENAASGDAQNETEPGDTKGGKAMDNNGRPKRRAPQPGVYYDAYGRPIAAPAQRGAQQPVGYDAYGRPVYAQRPPQKKPRAPIGYDAYGRPIYAPPQQKKPRAPIGYDAYGRPIYAPPQNRAPGARPARRRPGAPAPNGAPMQNAVPGQPEIVPGMDQDLQSAPQIPNQPMAASAADALASIEAQQQPGNANYYDEDYIPVVVHVDEDVDYNDGRYTPRLQGSFEQVDGGNSGISPTAPLRTNDEYNFNGTGNVTYRPQYDPEDMPVIVPSFEDSESDYSAPQGFNMMNNAPRTHAGVSSPAPASAQNSSRNLDPSFNASKNAEYTPDDEDHFVFVPHFDGDDPEAPAAPPEPPKPPRWKMAKMRRRKVRRRSRRGMLFKVRTDSFAEYTKSKIQ